MTNREKPSLADNVPEAATRAVDRRKDNRVDIEAKFLKALGKELLSARQSRGWTRPDPVLAMGLGQSNEAIASHEFGTRAMTVARFGSYCTALGLPPGRLIDRVYNDVVNNGLAVLDLAELARSEHSLAQWAAIRLRELPRKSMGRLLVPGPAQDKLAELCGCDRGQLFGALTAAA
ncbi:hypothetical protein ACFORO_05365 [Amycolatopsis halotolerans]|uniref:Helix-turn-helix domain-containing protein n=1 Tax=Amycolatopsis halotolerans TaxID=330083 RepID=A0ABV7Q8K3_9PSEU